jgi:hypothetical protein
MSINVVQDKEVVPVKGVHPTGKCSGSARAYTKKMLKRIHAAHLEGNTRLRRHLIELFLNSFEARLTAVSWAAKRFPKGERPDGATIRAIAQKLDPWKGTTEAVAVSFKKKPNSDKRRTVMSFGIENRALQYLILMVLEQTADLHPHQYATRGGVHAAIMQVAKALIDGYIYAVELDIKDCYPSFQGDKVPDLLPLPKEVTKHIAICRYLNLVPDNLTDLYGTIEGTPSIFTTDLLGKARHGIPQGSAASNLIADILLAKVLNQSPEGGREFSYADNVLLMSKTEAGMESMKLALESALTAHPAGPLVPSAKDFKAGDPIEFLGHRLTLKNGKVKIEPAVWKAAEFEDHVKSELSKITDKAAPVKKRLAKAKALRRYVRGFASAFKCCDDIASTKAFWLAKIAHAASPA